jgi:hypothetical protein
VDYSRDATNLSGPERAIVTRALRGEPIRPEDWERIGKRERREFAQKFGLDLESLPGSVAATRTLSATGGQGNGHEPGNNGTPERVPGAVQHETARAGGIARLSLC